MFDTLEGTVDQALERERAACRARLGELRERAARDAHEVSELVRAADDRRDWQAAGCVSPAEWFMQIYGTEYASAVRMVRTSDALRELPALDHALSTGELTLEQAAAAAPLATPESDAELARIAVGLAPREIARAARTLNPPVVADDQALYRRRALRMAWTGDGRELKLSGSLPLEQGVAFEQAIREHRQTPARTRQEATGSDARVAAVHRRCARHARDPARRQRRRGAAECDDADRAPQP